MDQFSQTQVNNQSQQVQQTGAPQKQPQRSSWQETLQLVNSLLVPSQEAVIIFKPNPTFDTLAASISLGLALKKIGRKVHIVSPGEINPEMVFNSPHIEREAKEMVDISQIVSFLPQKQLRLVIDYTKGSFSKGSINKTGEGLVLTLMPNSGEGIIEPLNMVTQVLEAKPDILFTMEIENLSHLQQFYTNNQSFFDRTPIVNIDYHPNNAMYGKANLIDAKASSMCEMTALMLYDLRFVFDAELAKILFYGMKAKTENFSSAYFSANMLEAASIALRYQQPPSPPAQTQ